MAGELRNVTVRREGEKWFASIQTRNNESVAALGMEPTLGIDLGLTAFAATSHGKLIEPLNALKKPQRKFKHAQRAVSRKHKGSAHRNKAIVRLGNTHRRIAHQRADWLHKLTSDLADHHVVIAIEDLEVKNMSAIAKGTAEVTYKLECRGGRVILVNPAYTSRTCRIKSCADSSSPRR